MADPLEHTRMPLRQHLEELRRCLIRALVGFAVLFVGAMVFEDALRAFILIPWEAAREGIVADGGVDPGQLIYIGPAEAFLFSLKLGAAMALLLGAPWYLWQLWSFVGAGLLPTERAAIGRAFPVATVLFVAGLVFGYTVLLPLGLQFLLTYADPDALSAQVTVSKYFGLLAALTLLMGFVFELPLVMWLVVRAGLVKVQTLGASRRVAYLAMLVFSAMMTPPDPVTQLLVTGPMIVLYEIGLRLAARAQAAHERAVFGDDAPGASGAGGPGGAAS